MADRVERGWMVRLEGGWARALAVIAGGTAQGAFSKPRLWCIVNQRAAVIPNAGSVKVVIARPRESQEH